MRRPLFLFSFCVVFAVALFRLFRPDGEETAPPDRSRIAFSGKIIQKNEDSFVIKIQTDNIFQRNATVLWQDNPKYQLHTVGRMFQCEYEEASELVLGSVIRLEGDFREYTHATNPGEFDYAAFYHSLDYAGKLCEVKILSSDGKKPGMREYLYRLHHFWERRLYQIFPEKEASVMTAMLLGDKTDLDPDIKALYKRSGIIHILSISGLHITLIGMGFYKRLRSLGVPVWAAALAGAVLLFLYGMLTGFGISTCRAIGMYLLRMGAQLVGRTYDMLTALGVTTCILVCTHPAWLGHMGFLLSVGAILGIGAFMPSLQRACREVKEEHGSGRKPVLFKEGKWRQRVETFGKKVGEIVSQGIWAGISVTLTTLPIQLWYSFEIPVYSLLLNVLILPFMGIVLAAGLLAMMIPGLGVVGTLDVIILAGYEGLCRSFEKLPFAVWNPGRPRVWQMVLYYLAWWLLVWGVPLISGRFRRLGKRFPGLQLQLALIVIAVALLGLPRVTVNRMTFLDVGQGDGMCLQLASGEIYLFDCGSSSRTKIGERVLIPFLKYNGISEVDAIFISHGDADHENGLRELLARSEEEHIRIRQVVLPGLPPDVLQEEFREVFQTIGQMPDPPAVTTIQSGVSWQSKARQGKAVSFLCLHPQPLEGSSAADRISTVPTACGGNACSECFFLSFPVPGSQKEAKVNMLLTGDVEGSGEQELLAALKTYQISDIDVLKCSHHGSKGTTSAEILAQIRPSDTVISCGRNNRYGHPHEELLERLEAVQSRIHQTPQTGAITVQIIKEGYRLTKFK